MKVADSALALIGAANLYRLADIVGGTRVYVPASFDDAKALRSTVGDDLAVLLVFHFGGSRIYVPTMKLPVIPSEAEIAALEKAGLSANEIARKLGCSQRTIHGHRNRKRTKGTTKP